MSLRSPDLWFRSRSRYCPSCKTNSDEVVKAGDKLKQSKKKAKMASASSKSSRDWGKVGTEMRYLNGELLLLVT